MTSCPWQPDRPTPHVKVKRTVRGGYAQQSQHGRGAVSPQVDPPDTGRPSDLAQCSYEKRR
jgi:hypothetical protein